MNCTKTWPPITKELRAITVAAAEQVQHYTMMRGGGRLMRTQETGRQGSSRGCACDPLRVDRKPEVNLAKTEATRATQTYLLPRLAAAGKADNTRGGAEGKGHSTHTAVRFTERSPEISLATRLKPGSYAAHGCGSGPGRRKAAKAALRSQKPALRLAVFCFAASSSNSADPLGGNGV